MKREERHTIFIRPDGTLEFIYHDLLRPLIDQAHTITINRVSSVEPNDQGKWVADLSAVGGPCSPEFDLREDALQWEVNWIQEQLATNTLTIR